MAECRGMRSEGSRDPGLVQAMPGFNHNTTMSLRNVHTWWLDRALSSCKYDWLSLFSDKQSVLWLFLSFCNHIILYTDHTVEISLNHWTKHWPTLTVHIPINVFQLINLTVSHNFYIWTVLWLLWWLLLLFSNLSRHCICHLVLNISVNLLHKAHFYIWVEPFRQSLHKTMLGTNWTTLLMRVRQVQNFPGKPAGTSKSLCFSRQNVDLKHSCKNIYLPQVVLIITYLLFVHKQKWKQTTNKGLFVSMAASQRQVKVAVVVLVIVIVFYFFCFVLFLSGKVWLTSEKVTECNLVIHSVDM